MEPGPTPLALQTLRNWKRWINKYYSGCWFSTGRISQTKRPFEMCADVYSGNNMRGGCCWLRWLKINNTDKNPTLNKQNTHNKEMSVVQRLRNWFRGFLSIQHSREIILMKIKSFRDLALPWSLLVRETDTPGVRLLNTTFAQMEMLEIKINLPNITASLA